MSNITKIKINQLKKLLNSKTIYENLSFTDINYDDNYISTIYDTTLNSFNLLLCKNIDDFVMKSISGNNDDEDQINDSDSEDEFDQDLLTNEDNEEDNDEDDLENELFIERFNKVVEILDIMCKDKDVMYIVSKSKNFNPREYYQDMILYYFKYLEIKYNS